MARVAKIDNAIKKRYARVERKRAIEIREKQVYFLIICEGEKTEPNYFLELKKELPIGTVELEIDGAGRNTIDLVNYTIKSVKKSSRSFDRVWVVFDKDDFPDDSFDNAISKAKANGINCAWSNQAFELWFLLHFQYFNVAMDRKEYKVKIEKEIKKKTGDENYQYNKNDPRTFKLLKKHGDQNSAIKRAKQLNELFDDNAHSKHNPCTRVHELLEEIFNPKNTLDKLNK